MAYRPLGVDRATPPRVKVLIRSLESHYLSDVHAMLRLPDFNCDLVAGCNFAIAQVLAAAVSGISVTLYSHNGGSGFDSRDFLRIITRGRTSPQMRCFLRMVPTSSTP